MAEEYTPDLYTLEDEDGNASLDNIDNDEEFERVSECFDEFLDEQEFNELP